MDQFDSKPNGQGQLPSIKPAGLALLACCVPILGCIHAPTDGGTAARDSTNAPRDECIINRGIRDFTALDNQNLILYGPGRRAYHVTLATPSLDLDHEISIGIYDTDGRLCSFGGDAIIVDGILRERISIRRIVAMDDEALDALLVQYGKIDAADAVTVTEIEIE